MGQVKNEKRARIARLALASPKKAAEVLRLEADGLAQCKNKEDVYFALSEIFGVSERTIYRDCQHDKKNTKN